MLGYEKSQMDDDDMGFSWTFFPEYIVEGRDGKKIPTGAPLEINENMTS
jgi:hypothetical protein